MHHALQSHTFRRAAVLIALVSALWMGLCRVVHADTQPVDSAATTQTIRVQAADLPAMATSSVQQAYFRMDETLVWQNTFPSVSAQPVAMGLVVFISPTDSGAIPEDWKPLLIQKNLVWMAADHAGNGASPQRRVLQALYAVQWARKSHTIDPRRIYIAGFSGGGRVATMMAPIYADLFRGGIFIAGANEIAYQPAELARLQKNRYAFINGEDDFNLAQSQRVYKKLKRSGIDGVRMIEVPGLGHEMPSAHWFAQAIDFLDGKLPTD